MKTKLNNLVILAAAAVIAYPMAVLAEPSAEQKAKNMEWKTKYFTDHPEADLDKNGELSWWELQTHKSGGSKAKKPASAKKPAPAPKAVSKAVAKKPDASKSDAEIWKDKYHGWHPDADANGDGLLSWPEYQAHKKDNAGKRPTPPKAVKKPAKGSGTKVAAKGKKSQNEVWKATYFTKHPEADVDGNGELSWYEYNTHRKVSAGKGSAPKAAPKAAANAGVKKDGEYWKAQYFKSNPDADTNGDGKLSWAEHKAHKAANP